MIDGPLSAVLARLRDLHPCLCLEAKPPEEAVHPGGFLTLCGFLVLRGSSCCNTNVESVRSAVKQRRARDASSEVGLAGVRNAGIGEHVDQRRHTPLKRTLERRSNVLGALHQLAVASKRCHHLVISGARA